MLFASSSHHVLFSPCNCVRDLNSLKGILGPWYRPDRFLGVTIWLHRWMVLSNGLEEGIRGRKVNFFLHNSKKPQKSTLFSGHGDYFLKKRTLVVFANSSALRFVACFNWEPRKKHRRKHSKYLIKGKLTHEMYTLWWISSNQRPSPWCKADRQTCELEGSRW